MAKSLKLMCVLAHPDDESLGMGGTLAKYADEGIETYLITATRGERGWFGAEADYPGPVALGKIRERELRQAANMLGIREVSFLDYVDGELSQADQNEVIASITTHLRRVQPDVVITFDPYGAYGHPDHIAICQLTSAAVICAADATCPNADLVNPHRVSKLYYRVGTAAQLAGYQQVFGDLVMHVDDQERRAISWPEWSITTRIDTADYWQQVWQAIACYQTQLPENNRLNNLTDSQKQALWHTETYYKVFSLTKVMRHSETSLFEGVHEFKE